LNASEEEGWFLKGKGGRNRLKEIYQKGALVQVSDRGLQTSNHGNYVGAERVNSFGGREKFKKGKWGVNGRRVVCGKKKDVKEKEGGSHEGGLKANRGNDEHPHPS